MNEAKNIDDFQKELELLRLLLIEKGLSQDIFYLSPLDRKKIYDLAKKYNEEKFVLALDLIVAEGFKFYIESNDAYKEFIKALYLMKQSVHQPNREQLHNWQNMAEDLWSINDSIDEENEEYLAEIYGKDWPESIKEEVYLQGMAAYIINTTVFRFADLWWSCWDNPIINMEDNFDMTFDVRDVALVGALTIDNPLFPTFNPIEHHKYWMYWLKKVIPEALSIARYSPKD